MKKKCLECTELNPKNARKCRACGNDFSAGGWAMDDGNNSSETILDDYNDDSTFNWNKENSSERTSNTTTQFPKIMNVDVKDIDMSFSNMVVFMVKWAIASIPAMIILFMIGFALAVTFGLIAR